MIGVRGRVPRLTKHKEEPFWRINHTSEVLSPVAGGHMPQFKASFSLLIANVEGLL